MHFKKLIFVFISLLLSSSANTQEEHSISLNEKNNSVSSAEILVLKIDIVKTLYPEIKDWIQFFEKKEKKSSTQVDSFLNENLLQDPEDEKNLDNQLLKGLIPERDKWITYFSEIFLKTKSLDDLLSASFNSQLLTEDEKDELNVIVGSSSPERSLYGTTNRTITHLGRATLAVQLISPSENYDFLMKKAVLLKTLEGRKKENERLKETLSNFKKIEGSILGLWNSNDPFNEQKKKKDLENKFFLNQIEIPVVSLLEKYLGAPGMEEILEHFITPINKSYTGKLIIPISKKLKPKLDELNKSIIFISVINLINLNNYVLLGGLWQSIITVKNALTKIELKKLTPDIPKLIKNIKKLNFTTIVKELGHFSTMGLLRSKDKKNSGNKASDMNTAFLSFFTIMNSIMKIEKTKRKLYDDPKKLLESLRTRIYSVHQTIKIIKQLHIQLRNKNMKRLLPYEEKIISTFIEKVDKNPLFKELDENIKTSKKFENSNFINQQLSRAHLIISYRIIQDIKDTLIDPLMVLAKLDILQSTLSLIDEHKNKDKSYNIVTPLKKEQAGIHLKGTWNPLLQTKRIVTNDLVLTESNSSRFGIITGPNAGGKSTYMKSSAISIILFQTLGIAPVESAAIVPFTMLRTFINIEDDIEENLSRFKAEVKKAKFILDEAKSLKEDEFSFFVIDELFTGTSPGKGAALAYATLQHLGSFPKTFGLIATHFDDTKPVKLIDLPLDPKTKGVFRNYKVTVKEDENGKIFYPFKIIPGIAKQNIAVKILEEEDFPDELLNNLHEILDEK